jgi:hypothetical protein
VGYFEGGDEAVFDSNNEATGDLSATGSVSFQDMEGEVWDV